MDPDAEPTLLRHPQVRTQACRRGARRDVRRSPCPHTRPLAGLSLQGTVVFTTHVPALGRYAFLLHGYQPAHPTFAVEVLVNGGRIWQGEHIWGGCGAGQTPDQAPDRASSSARVVTTQCAQMECGSRGPWHGACHLAVSDRSAHPSCHQFSNRMPSGPPSVQCGQPRLPAPP